MVVTAERNDEPVRPIRVGHSPDPDDAFMFYALAKGKIDTGRYRFTHELVDIETLNRRALARRAGTDGRSAFTPTPT